MHKHDYAVGKVSNLPVAVYDKIIMILPGLFVLNAYRIEA